MTAIRDRKIATVKKALLQELRGLVKTREDFRTHEQVSIVTYFADQLIDLLNEEHVSIDQRPVPELEVSEAV